MYKKNVIFHALLSCCCFYWSDQSKAELSKEWILPHLCEAEDQELLLCPQLWGVRWQDI